MKVKKTAAREPIPAGVYYARCYSLIHFGTIPENSFGEDGFRDKVRLAWELPTELRVFDENKGEQPLSISKEYTASLNEKSNLYHDLSSWLGDMSKVDEFELTDVVGKECMLNIQHKTSSKGNVYAYIAAITPLARGSKCPPAINPPFIWDYESHFDLGILENLHEYYREIIKSSLEYKDKMNPIDLPEAPFPVEQDELFDDLP